MNPTNQMNEMNHTPNVKTINPSILYYGTPVILLNTVNEDGTTNISPISSSWALGDCVVLGIGTGGKALENMERHPECVINVPGPSMWENVERLAPYTGKNPVPAEKRNMDLCTIKISMRSADSLRLSRIGSSLPELGSALFKLKPR